HHYDLTPEGNAQFAKLNYGQLIVVTDQDLDGHNICGLCCANILSFWPALLKRGFLKKMNTPIIRVLLAGSGKSSSRSKEFFSIQDYNDWSTSASKHTAKYCKGLGSNNRDESISMFSGIEKKLIALAEDEKTFINLHNYYGRDPEVRKRILIRRNSEKALQSTATLSEFLETNVHEYQRYNIARKIPSLYDGLTLAKRKALFAAIKELSDSAKEIKVIQLTGAVIKHSAYHHGDASMNETITKMAQTYPGAKILPPFLPEGQVGSFKKGGKDRAQARYVSVRLNRQLTRLNYPKEDQYVLDYEFDEGDADGGFGHDM
ncbi:MAG: DNA gyrase subunit A, partial [Undibacterium sp.]